jgi:DNA primase large subunit
LDEDTRIIPLLNNLSQGFLSGANFDWGSSTAATGDGLTADMVDEMAHKHFPLCMRYQHEELRKRKHLPHFSRLEYGLFLKVGSRSTVDGSRLTEFTQVLGLPIEEALIFWRKSFSKTTDDKFNKEYKYNIRHSFGLEGKRANYPAKT